MNTQFIGNIQKAIDYLNLMYPNRAEPLSDTGIQAMNQIIENVTTRNPGYTERMIKIESFSAFRDWARGTGGHVQAAITSTVQQAQEQEKAQAAAMYAPAAVDPLQELYSDIKKALPLLIGGGVIIFMFTQRKKRK